MSCRGLKQRNKCGNEQKNTDKGLGKNPQPETVRNDFGSHASEIAVDSEQKVYYNIVYLNILYWM